MLNHWKQASSALNPRCLLLGMSWRQQGCSPRIVRVTSVAVYPNSAKLSTDLPVDDTSSCAQRCRGAVWIIVHPCSIYLHHSRCLSQGWKSRSARTRRADKQDIPQRKMELPRELLDLLACAYKSEATVAPEHPSHQLQTDSLQPIQASNEDDAVWRCLGCRQAFRPAPPLAGGRANNTHALALYLSLSLSLSLYCVPPSVISLALYIWVYRTSEVKHAWCSA